jgi:hypothetical protein
MPDSENPSAPQFLHPRDPDPWEQEFRLFKSHYTGDITSNTDPPPKLGSPEVTIFEASELRTLLENQAIVHLAVYAVRFKPTTTSEEEHRMIAVPMDASNNRVPDPDPDPDPTKRLNYISSTHNCPPNCRGTVPPPVVLRANLMLSGSID